MHQRIAVFIIKDGNVLLLHRRKNSAEYYAVPGGGREEGETEAETAVREIKEETGLDIVLGDKVSSLTVDGSKQEFYVAQSFEGEVKLGVPELERQSPENFYQLEWVPFAALDSVNLREEIKTIIKSRI